MGLGALLSLMTACKLCQLDGWSVLLTRVKHLSKGIYIFTYKPLSPYNRKNVFLVQPRKPQTPAHHLSTLPPFSAQSSQLPGYSPTLDQPASLASPAAARLRTPALQ